MTATAWGPRDREVVLELLRAHLDGMNLSALAELVNFRRSRELSISVLANFAPEEIERMDDYLLELATGEVLRGINHGIYSHEVATFATWIANRMNAIRPCVHCSHGHPFHDNHRRTPELVARHHFRDGECSLCGCPGYSQIGVAS